MTFNPDDIRVVNFYKDIKNADRDTVRVWRYELQVRHGLGEWRPIPVIEREDVSDIPLPTSEVDWSN
jgi:hypothetical protein